MAAAASSSSQVLDRIGRALAAPFAAPPPDGPDLEGMLSLARANHDVASELLDAAMKSKSRKENLVLPEVVALLRSLGMREEVLEPTAKAITDHRFRRFGLLHLASIVGEQDFIILLARLWLLDTNDVIGGLTPLMLAVKDSNEVGAVRYLLDFHAKVESPVHTAETLVSAAVENGNAPMVKLLLLRTNGVGRCTSPLAIAARRGFAFCIPCLLESGEDPHYIDEDGRKPIQAAAAGGHRECVKLLFEVTRLGYDETVAMFNMLESFGVQENQVEMEIPEEITLYQLKKQKGTVNIYFAIMDKIPTSLIAVCGFGLAYMTTEKRDFYMKSNMFQLFCCACIMSFCTSIILHGSTAFYKELESVDESGFGSCCYCVLGMVIFFLLALSIVFFSFEGAKLGLVIGSAVLTLLVIILSWPLPQKDSKSVGRCVVQWIKKKWANRSRFLRFGGA